MKINRLLTIFFDWKSKMSNLFVFLQDKFQLRFFTWDNAVRYLIDYFVSSVHGWPSEAGNTSWKGIKTLKKVTNYLKMCSMAKGNEIECNFQPCLEIWTYPIQRRGKVKHCNASWFSYDRLGFEKCPSDQIEPKNVLSHLSLAFYWESSEHMHF